MKSMRSLLMVLLVAVCAAIGACSRNADVIEVEDAGWTVAVYEVLDTAEISNLFAGTPVAYDLSRLNGEFAFADTRVISERYVEYKDLFVSRNCAFRWMRMLPQTGDGSQQLYKPVVVKLPAVISEKVNKVKVSSFNGTDYIQMAFEFADKKLWENATTANLDRPLAIAVNGKIFNAPRVMSAVDNGACNVIATYAIAETLLPGVDLSPIKPKFVTEGLATSPQAVEEPTEVLEPLTEVKIVDDAAPAEGSGPVSKPTGDPVVKDTKEVVEAPARSNQGIEDIVKVEPSGSQNSASDEVFNAVEVMPSFPGGQSEMATWLGNNMKYPPTAAENNIQGRVVVGFIVEKDGSISNVKVMRGKDPELDKEAVRLVKSMPRWTPGTRDGQRVRVSMVLPVNFKIA